MTETVRVISLRDPESFKTIIAHEISHRELFKNFSEDKVDELKYHEPVTFTLDEFKEKLNAIGTVTRFETYVDHDCLFEVTRGSVVRDNIEHYFQIVYPVNSLYRVYVQGAISNIMYTKVV